MFNKSDFTGQASEALASHALDIDAPFHVHAGAFPFGTMAVVGFEGRESMNRLYRFDIRVESPATSGDIERGVLDQPGSLFFRGAGPAQRAVHGIFAGVSSSPLSANGHRTHRLRLVPRGKIELLTEKTCGCAGDIPMPIPTPEPHEVPVDRPFRMPAFDWKLVAFGLAAMMLMRGGLAVAGA